LLNRQQEAVISRVLAFLSFLLLSTDTSSGRLTLNTIRITKSSANVNFTFLDLSAVWNSLPSELNNMPIAEYFNKPVSYRKQTARQYSWSIV